MKKTLSLTLVAAALGVSLPAHASDGIILFSGGVLAQTCTVNPDSLYTHVELPLVGTSALQEGATAGYVPFEIKLKNCPADHFPYLHFQSQYVDPDSGNLLNAVDDGDNGVQVQILSDGLPINLYSNDNRLPNYRFESEDTVLRYGARYIAVRDAEPGPFLSQVDYVVAYE